MLEVIYDYRKLDLNWYMKTWFFSFEIEICSSAPFFFLFDSRKKNTI